MTTRRFRQRTGTDKTLVAWPTAAVEQVPFDTSTEDQGQVNALLMAQLLAPAAAG